MKCKLPLHYEMCGSNCWAVLDADGNKVSSTIDDSPLGLNFDEVLKEHGTYENYIIKQAEKSVQSMTNWFIKEDRITENTEI